MSATKPYYWVRKPKKNGCGRHTYQVMFASEGQASVILEKCRMCGEWRLSPDGRMVTKRGHLMRGLRAAIDFLENYK